MNDLPKELRRNMSQDPRGDLKEYKVRVTVTVRDYSVADAVTGISDLLASQSLEWIGPDIEVECLEP